MKIGLLIPSLSSGGMERVMSELSNYFAEKSNIEVHLVLYGQPSKKFYLVSPKIIIHEPPIEFFYASKLFQKIRVFRWLRRLLRNEDFYSILSFGETFNNFVLLAAFGLNIPTYVSDRSSPDKNWGFLHETLRKYLYKQAAGVICQTNYGMMKMSKRGVNRNNTVIGNPIRRVQTEPITIEENWMVSVGRLIPTKNFDRLIAMYEELNRKDWQLYILGGDVKGADNLSSLKKLVLDRGLEDFIHFTGAVTNVDEYLSKSKIFLFASSSEGFPNVLGEAMSAGLPVISYDCVSGPADLIKDGENGFLVPLFSDELYKERILSLMDSQSLRSTLGRNAKLTIESQYSTKNICEEYLRSITK